MVGAVCSAGRDRVGVLGIHRPRKAGYYAYADRQKVEILLPHLQRALHLVQRLAGTSPVQASSFDALASHAIGLIVFDRSRRIVRANVLAKDMLRTSPAIGVLNAALVMRDHHRSTRPRPPHPDTLNHPHPQPT